MPKIIDETPVATLNNLLAKLRIVPKFELIFSDVNRRTPKFIMRVTSPITPGGPPLAAEGCFGLSKKEAKHNAALTFMQAFLNYGNEVQHMKARTDSKPTVDTGTDIYSEGLKMLEIICTKKNLRRPEIRDIRVEGQSGGLIFASECIVSDLCINGRGKSRVEARLHATSRMIQILMETAPIHEILGFPQLTPEMLQFTLKSNTSKTAPPIDNQKGSQLPVQNGSNGKRKMDESSLDKPSDMHRAPRKPETAKTLLELLEARKKDVKIEENNDNSESNVNLIQLAENLKKKKLATESSDTLLNNNIPHVVNNEYVNKDSDEIQNNLTRLRAVSEIDRILRDSEKQFYYKILNLLAYSHLAHHQTVAIFSHTYQVLINENSSPQIFEGNNECTDQSIRVACLTKLLLDIKEHINNHAVIKQEQ